MVCPDLFAQHPHTYAVVGPFDLVGRLRASRPLQLSRQRRCLANRGPREPIHVHPLTMGVTDRVRNWLGPRNHLQATSIALAPSSRNRRACGPFDFTISDVKKTIARFDLAMVFTDDC